MKQQTQSRFAGELITATGNRCFKMDLLNFPPSQAPPLFTLTDLQLRDVLGRFCTLSRGKGTREKLHCACIAQLISSVP